MCFCIYFVTFRIDLPVLRLSPIRFQSVFFSFQLLCAVTNSKNIRKKTKYRAFSANDSINAIKTQYTNDTDFHECPKYYKHKTLSNLLIDVGQTLT